MIPGENLNQVAAEQVRALLHQPGRERRAVPIVSFDAGYDPLQLGIALAHEGVHLLVRLRSGRCFYAPPETLPVAATGRPRRHGAACADAATWPPPTAEWTQTTGDYGVVRLRAWAGLHAIAQNHAQRGTRQAKPLVTGTLIRLEVDHLPRPTKSLWVWWGPSAPDLATVWHVYIARLATRAPVPVLQADLEMDDTQTAVARRWTWLLILAYLQLRFAQPLVQEVRLPWHPRVPVEKLTPARVRRASSSVLAIVGSPASVPKPWGRSPGRPTGKRSPPAKRVPAVKLTA